MTVAEMFDAALAVINEHNSVVGQGNPGYLDPNEFQQCIKAAGGTTAERLKSLSYEDILACMPEAKVKPIVLAKDIAKIFRGKEDSTSTHEARPVSAKKADRMSLRELIEAYDPEEADNPVGKRLKEISKGEKFIVFVSGRTVDVETTLKLLQEIKQGFPGRDSIEVAGEVREIHALGDLPDNFVDENPLYRQRPLRPDGTCDQTNRSWNGVPQRVRQLIRVAMDRGALTDLSYERVHDIMDLAMDADAFNKFSKRYPTAAVEFKKLESLNKLPTLKLVLKVEKGAGGSKRPFDNPKKVEFTPPALVQRALHKNQQAKWLHSRDLSQQADSYTEYYANWRKDHDNK